MRIYGNKDNYKDEKNEILNMNFIIVSKMI